MRSEHREASAHLPLLLVVSTVPLPALPHLPAAEPADLTGKQEKHRKRRKNATVSPSGLTLCKVFHYKPIESTQLLFCGELVSKDLDSLVFLVFSCKFQGSKELFC